MRDETMSDTPKFEVIDRRKMKADEEKEGIRFLQVVTNHVADERVTVGLFHWDGRKPSGRGEPLPRSGQCRVKG